METALGVTRASTRALRDTRWAPLVAVAFGVFVDYLIYGAIVPLTPYSPAGRASASELPLLYGAYSVGVLASTPVFGMLADRLGYRTVMWISAGLSIPAVLLLWHSEGFAPMLIGRLFQGAASAATWTAGLALIASRYKNERVRMIGLTLMASTGGSVIGPIMSGALYEWGGYALPFVVLCVFAAVDAVSRFLLLPRDAPSGHRDGGIVGLLADSSIAGPAIAVVIAAGAWGIIEPVLPRHLETSMGIGAAEIGLIFTLSTIVYGLMSPVVSIATGRFGTARTVVGGIVLMAALLPPLALAPNLAWTGLVLCAVNAAFAFLLNPTSAALGDAVEQRGLSCYGAVYAIYNIAYAIGMMSASTLGAALSGRFTVFQIMLCVSAILVACIPVAWRSGRVENVTLKTS